MPQDDTPGSDINYVKEAAKLQYNWIALAGIGAFAIISGSALPLILGAGLELMYLSLVPQNSRFRRLVRSWRFEESRHQNDLTLGAMYQEVPQDMKNRYNALNQLVWDIHKNYSRLSSTSQMFAGQMDEKLRGLLQAYLRLLHGAFQHRQYLRTTDLGAVQSELAALRKAQESQSARVQEINTKRVEILNKRIDKFKKIEENCQVIDAQCAAVEDVLGLIRDQSVTMRDPQELTNHLEGLVHDVEQTEDTVREMENIFANMDVNGIAPLPSDAGGMTSGAASKNRVQS